MSAYAALVSLLQILESILDPRSCWNFHNRAQLDSLFVKVTFFLDFLENSSTYKSTQISALETKMRAAAYKAEDLIESQKSRILESNHRSRRLRVLMIESIIYFCFSFLIFRNRVHVIKIFMLVIATFVILAVGLNLALQASNYWDFTGYRAQETQKLRLVLYDMNFIADKVIRVKEERVHELDMSAYAALLSLRLILDSILESGVAWRYHNRNQLNSLHEKVAFLLEFLGNTSAYMTSHRSALQTLEAAITDVVYKAQQLVEFEIPSASILESEMSSFRVIRIFILPTLLFCLGFAGTVIVAAHHLMTKLLAGWIVALAVGIGFGIYVLGNVSNVVRGRAMINPGKQENQELRLVIDDFSIIVKDVTTIKDACGDLNNLSAAAAAATSSSTRRDVEGSGRDVVVGLDSDLIEIKVILLQHSSKRELVSIVGMGGIGKTTLAGLAFKDHSIRDHFDVCAWVTVSQEYSLHHVLLCLLDYTQVLTEEKRQDNEEELGVYLHQYLIGRRYLIVMDDVWDTDIWDFLSRFLPENFNGSRVLLTSRLPNVVNCLDSGCPLHHMQCLDENESWDLLREKIFGEERCLLDLESIGKKIATSCRGHPLAIVVIAGLLYKAIQIEVWRDVAEKLKESQLEDIKEHCLEILGLSYNHLPHHLRPCFLYMGVFPADCEISISRLINLWVAEGFLKPQTSKTLEEVAEGYLEDLINRNLILVRKRSRSGKIRTCSVHDLLRDVCVENASKENFLHVVDSMGNVTRDRHDESSRRLSIHPDALQLQVNDRTSCYDNVRSVLCIADKPINNPLATYLGFIYLRVLNVLEVHFGEFPHQIIKLVRLRYLALHFDGPLPASISTLQNLETIVHHSSFRNYPLLPRVIWSMPNLRHIYVKPGCYLFNPLGYRLPLSFTFLPNLQTLVGIRNFKWTKGIIKHVPNLKKLSIFYHVSSCADLSKYQLETLVYLHQLASLKIICKYDDNDVGSTTFDDPPKIAFPQKLRKLSLSGCRFPWESMAAIGALPNLEALKLRCGAFCGPSWETVEGEFPQLVFLLLEEISFTRWESDEAHFPRLERLVLRSCHMLEEIPYGIGDIPTLEIINLADCHPSAVASAKQMMEDQESMGNETLKLVIERLRDVNEVNLGSSDARGVGPGAFQIVRDSILNAGNEIMLVVSLLMIRWPFLSNKVKYHLGSQRSS